MTIAALLEFVFRTVRMAHVLYPSTDDFIPSSLTRVPFDKITVELDTSKYYVQVYNISMIISIDRSID